ncbi:MAG: peptide ABC transporter substrate-binding protein, partial [Proteobacteria bacterium]|nr:peptide ABC transporter substrate-binding protein [Pseudomonadota bacterium]
MKTLATAAAFAAAASLAFPAYAQKSGGTLHMLHRDNPPSASIHEEATNSVIEPF